MALSTYKRSTYQREPIFESKILNNMADIYYSQSRFQEAIDYYKRVVDVFLKQNKDSVDCASVFDNIGLVYKANGEFQSALEYFEKALLVY
jgi:tetratricopeptide (TPR) repeat protein